MGMPLMISAAMLHAADHHGKTGVVALAIEGDIRRDNHAPRARTQKLANALRRLGVQQRARPGAARWREVLRNLLPAPFAGLGFRAPEGQTLRVVAARRTLPVGTHAGGNAGHLRTSMRVRALCGHRLW